MIEGLDESTRPTVEQALYNLVGRGYQLIDPDGVDMSEDILEAADRASTAMLFCPRISDGTAAPGETASSASPVANGPAAPSLYATDLIGLRERIERRLTGILSTSDRVAVVGVLGAEFNELLLLRNGNGAVVPGGGASPSAAAGGPAAPLPRLFELFRLVDHSGVSGPGVVAYGVQFPSGRVALHWHSNRPSTAAWDSVDDMLAVHGHGGDTILRWLDGVQ